jgi:putative SOS response-associated peptidase YedK
MLVKTSTLTRLHATTLKMLLLEVLRMCGRNSLFIDQADLEARFDAEVVTDGGYTPRYNIAPGDDLHIITNEAPDEIDAYHWGPIPFWADEPEEGIINARSETADEKRVFEQAWESRPCLVLSSGFYEWKSPNGGSKQPYRIYREDDPAFAMAVLWDIWGGRRRDDLVRHDSHDGAERPNELNPQPNAGRSPKGR